MVTVTSRPQGHKIIDQAITAHITDSSGDALVTFTSHGLTDGDFIYIESDIDEYNGFWEVDAINANTFKLVLDDGFVEYYQDQEITYYQTQSHDWSSIFLPIMYKATNNRWPTNSVDSVQLIVIGADDNGFTEITTAGPIKSDIRALEFIKISGASTATANGVWQVVEVSVSNVYTINLPYELAGSLTGASAQYYYNNYQVRVKVYAGLPPLHPWEGKKPMEEVAELSLTPDENNNVIFSVSDYIKLKVAIKNNLTLFSLPLNLDALTGFYIATGESYDASDNYALYTVESEFTDDTFEGYAVAGKLPFKNVYAGDYSEYVYTSGSPAKWLTNRERLLAVEGYYFDISFIKNLTGNFYIQLKKYLSADYFITELVQIDDQGVGVYRIPITPDASYRRICATVYHDAVPGFVPAVMTPFLDWENSGTADPPELVWEIVDTYIQVDTDGLGLGPNTNFWHTDYEFEEGQTYTFGYSVQGNGCEQFNIDIVDSVGNVLENEVVSPSDTSVVSGTFTFVAPAGAAAINLWLYSPCSCGAEDPEFCLKKWLSFTNLTTGSGGEDAYVLTEEICIDILETCEIENGFTPSGDRRLLEDGDYRLLE